MTTEEFNRIWVPLGERMYKVAFYILESEDDAMDAVQDLFVKLWNKKDDLQDVRAPLAYSLELTKNQCLDRIRSKNVRQTDRIDEAKVGFPDPNTAPDDDFIGRETVRIVRQCVAELPDNQRNVLEMRVFKGLSYEDISEKTGLSQLNLRVLLSLARKSLRSKIAKRV